MSTQPARRTRKNYSRRTTAILLAGAFLVLAAFYVVDRFVLNPWSFSSGGRPTLTGYWQGAIDFGPNDRRDVVVHLRYNWDPGTARSGGGWDPLEGTMRVCGKGGPRVAELGGEPENRSGSAFEVDTTYPDTGPGDRLFQIRGEWAGDRIAMRARWTTQLPDGRSVRRTEEEASLAFELRRADRATFERACPT